jgi:hypothetical protein
MSEKWTQLTKRLLELDKRGSVEWVESDSSDGIQTSLGSFVVLIREIEALNQYVFVLKKANGDVFDDFTDDDLTSFGFPNAYQQIKDLYRSVHRKVSGADDAIDEMLSELDKKDGSLF